MQNPFGYILVYKCKIHLDWPDDIDLKLEICYSLVLRFNSSRCQFERVNLISLKKPYKCKLQKQYNRQDHINYVGIQILRIRFGINLKLSLSFNYIIKPRAKFTLTNL